MTTDFLPYPVKKSTSTNKMNAYAVMGHGPLLGGVDMVAANSEDEALALAKATRLITQGEAVNQLNGFFLSDVPRVLGSYVHYVGPKAETLASDVPRSFTEAMDDSRQGRVVDMETALSQTPTGFKS